MRAEIDGYILAGGKSERMGSDKAMLAWEGRYMIEQIYDTMQSLFRNVTVVTKRESPVSRLALPVIYDLTEEYCAMNGLLTVLSHLSAERAFIKTCDTPYLNLDLVARMIELSEQSDIVVARTPDGMNPLLGIYSKACLSPVKQALDHGLYRITGLFGKVNTCCMSPDEVKKLDPEFESFKNINTPEDYERYKAGSSR